MTPTDDQLFIRRADVYGIKLFGFASDRSLTPFRYHQAHAPIVEQQTIEGHSVRATYLLAGVADLLRIDGKKGDVKMTEAVYRLWNNMINCKMYVTGGIGAIKQWEGFGPNYFLPQGADEGGCYSETCAAIGVMMVAERMLQVSAPMRPRGDPHFLIIGRLTSTPNLQMSWSYVCITLF